LSVGILMNYFVKIMIDNSNLKKKNFFEI